MATQLGLRTVQIAIYILGILLCLTIILLFTPIPEIVLTIGKSFSIPINSLKAMRKKIKKSIKKLETEKENIDKEIAQIDNEIKQLSQERRQLIFKR